MRFSDWLQSLQPGWEVLRSLGVLVLAFLVGLLAVRFVLGLVTRWADRIHLEGVEFLLRRWRRPLRLLLPIAAILLVLPGVQLPADLEEVVREGLALVLIGAIAWLSASSTLLFRDFVLSKYDISQKDNLKARQIYTQIQVVERIVIFAIIVIAISSMLMTFDKVRQVGVSILASAGILGIIVGFAAQHSLGTLFAGIQIAITQPIRIDDVVIVEGEWGRIEEITLTYVVVRIWDLRRLVVPITYFLQNAFQNWTRISADLLGTVFLYGDYRTPVDAVREELHRILLESPEWDGTAWGLQVTNATDRTIELRALMSAADSGSAWNLRCAVREKLLRFLQEKHPESLPRVRAELRPFTPSGEPPGTEPGHPPPGETPASSAPSGR